MALIGEMKYLTIGSNTYEIPTSELPIASSSTLGGIKVGSGLAIDSSTGVLNIASPLPYVVELEYVGSGDGSSSIWQSTETVAEVKTKIDNSTVVILKAGHDFLYFNSYDRGNDLHFYGGMDNNLVAYPNSGQNNTWAIEQIDETIYWDDIVDKPTIPTISITRNLTSGTKSATINISGTDYDIYSTDDTKNTAGSTDDTTNSLYIIGATSQGVNPQTYSNKNFHIRGSYLYLGYNGTTTVTGLCFYYGSYYATMVYGGAVTGDTYTPILKFSSATPANGVILRNIANPRNDEDAVNRGYLISALSNKVSDYSLKTEDNYKQVIDLENYSGGFNISSTVYPDEEGTVVNATRLLNARFYDGALAIKAVDFTENNTSFNGYLAINKDEVNLGKINSNVVTSYIKIDNNGTTIKNVVTPTANTDAANKQYVDAAIPDVSGKVNKTGDTITGILVVNSTNSGKLQFYNNNADFNQTITLSAGIRKSSYDDDYSGYLFIDKSVACSATPSFDNDLTNKLYVDTRSLPTGGTAGQVLKKTSSTNYAVEWGAVDALPVVTSSDNNKVLTVVNGAWAAASLPIYNGGVS